MNLRTGDGPLTSTNYVLVLTDGTEHDVLGIWGPYLGVEYAGRALAELRRWPLDGEWTITELKTFQPSPLTVNTDPTIPDG